MLLNIVLEEEQMSRFYALAVVVGRKKDMENKRSQLLWALLGSSMRPSYV